MHKDIIKTLSFYNAIERPLTSHELWQKIPPKSRPENFGTLLQIIDNLESKELVKGDSGFLFTKNSNSNDLIQKREQQDNLLKEKWQKLLKYRRIFNAIPFINFALVAGSMALGNVNENSDFDIIIGCEKGKIFTTRLLTMLTFSILGKRRKSTDSKIESKDKFCFSHFVTPAGYKLNPPYNLYWHQLYQSLVSIYGDEDDVIKFFKANNWLDREVIIFDNKWKTKNFNLWRVILEIILKSPLGKALEKAAKVIQMRRITEKRPTSEHSRVIASDEELEFHPDTSRIQEIIDRVLQHTKL